MSLCHTSGPRRRVNLSRPTRRILDIMTSLHSRLAAAALALAIAAALLGVAAPAKVLEPNKLIILSTTDVKGENEPCG